MSALLQDRQRGYSLTVLGVLWLSPDALLLRMIGADALDLLGWRTGLSALVLLAFMFWRDGWQVWEKMKRQGWRLAFLALLYGLNSYAFVAAIEHSSVADALVIIASTPLIAAVMSYLILKEIVSLRTAIAIMIGAVGVGITAYGGLSGSTPFGMAMAALCALMLAASFTLLRAWREVDPVASIMLGSAGAAVFSFGFADPMVIEGASLFWAFVLGLILAPISFALISIGPKYIPSAEVSLIMLLETLLGPLWVWAALGEVPAMTAILGGLTIMLAVAITASSAFRRSAS